MNPETFDLAAFATANPDRPILLILPATSGTSSAPPSIEPSAQRAPTLLYGEAERDDAGELRVGIHLQADLDLRTITFHGSTPEDGLRVQRLFIGDAPIFMDQDGVPVARFEHPMLSSVLTGWLGRAGLDLTVVAEATGPARLCVSVRADKLLHPCT